MARWRAVLSLRDARGGSWFRGGGAPWMCACSKQVRNDPQWLSGTAAVPTLPEQAVALCFMQESLLPGFCQVDHFYPVCHHPFLLSIWMPFQRCISIVHPDNDKARHKFEQML